MTSSLPGSDRAYSVQGLTPGTSYVFELRGLTGTGTGDSGWTACAAAATQGAPPACQVLSATATSTNGNIAVRKNSGGLQNDVAVAVNTSGTCGALRVRFVPTGTTQRTAALNASYQTTIAKNAYSWSIGNKQLELLDATNHVVAVVSLRVCSTSSCST